MTSETAQEGSETPEHDHVFLGANPERNERRVWLFIASIASETPKTVAEYKAMLDRIDHVSHTTVEVHHGEQAA